MSPSRGLLRSLLPPLTRQIPAPNSRRTLSTFRTLSTSQTPFQIYISTSHSPYLNLSIEHHLFQTTPEKSTILFLYTNSPSIVIGRNQNPWVEVNLPLLHKPDGPKIDLVRRRSGGGTVFHDMGNVNYSVCMPTASFDRDRHAEMVVRALHGLGAKSATVNKRHDIVLLPAGVAAEHTKMEGEAPEGTKKVSGSAFKLTRLRSYHHGTMLLDSRLEDVRAYLRSPARVWLMARGVDSVWSPVTNVGVVREKFVEAVVEEFRKMYLGEKEVRRDDDCEQGQDIGICYIGDEALEVEKIKKGVEELESPEWIYGQTPQLTFSIPPPKGSQLTLEELPQILKDIEISIVANKGIIESVNSTTHSAITGLVGKKFDGRVINSHMEGEARDVVGSWIESILGRTRWGSLS